MSTYTHGHPARGRAGHTTCDMCGEPVFQVFDRVRNLSFFRHFPTVKHAPSAPATGKRLRKGAHVIEVTKAGRCRVCGLGLIRQTRNGDFYWKHRPADQRPRKARTTRATRRAKP